MAKKKTRVLWLSKEKPYTDKPARYHLWRDKPIWSEDGQEFHSGGIIRDFCGREFEQLCPSFKLRKNIKCKLKLTQLKNGIKLEKVK